MTRRRIVKLALLVVACVIATALGYGGYLVSRLAPIGAAYAAKTLCSGVFVSGRQPEEVMREDILADNHPLLKAVWPAVDRTRQLASATFLGLALRQAQYRPGLGCTLAIGTERAQLPTLALPAVLSPRDAAPRGDDPPIGVAADASVDLPKLQAAIDDAFAEPDAARLRRTRALIVMHRGRILSERYAAGFSADMPLLGWSMTKSVTAALIGTLVRGGKLSTDRVALLPQWSGPGDGRARITLDQLLRMTSGLRFRENHGDPLEDVALMLFASADAAAYAIDKPLEFAPGTHWSYSSGTSTILSRVIRLAVGGSEEDYLQYPRRALFDRIGMRSAVIEPDASGSLLASSYMYASARDWARFGQLLLQDGVWHGEHLLPEGWVRYMATLTPQSVRRDFGAHLWLKVPPPFDSPVKPGPSLPSDAFHVVGHEGQFVSVMPSRALVVVRLGLSRGSHVWDHDAFLARLLEAFPPVKPD